MDPIVPNRMTLTNLFNQSFMTAQFNPKELKDKVAANYEDVQLMGMSHEVGQYKGTTAQEFTFELGFDAHSMRGSDLGGPIASQATEASIGGGRPKHCERMLRSLLYPPRGAQDVGGGAPPRVLFSWPGFISVVATVRTLEITYKRFTSKGPPTWFVAAVTLKEARDARITMEDVELSGLLR